jgi:CobQ-like glutamine amidotransferase family enzyme
MKIEVLYPEICCLYGDRGNITYLKQCLPEADFVETPLRAAPAFASEQVDLIYMGSMTEKGQEKVIEQLRPYRDRLRQLIEQGTVFLLVGNSFETFGRYIETEDGAKIEGLDLLALYAKRYLPQRFNSLFLGEFAGQSVVGYTSRFSHAFSDGTVQPLFKVHRGLGLSVGCLYEGVRENNLFATYLLGPLLIDNPPFTRYLLSLLGVERELPFTQAIEQAYQVRVAEYSSNIEFS